MVRADRIVVYKTERCGFCTAAVRYLQEGKGQQVEVVDLTGDREARMALMQRTGQRTVPQIWVGETHVGGFDDLRALDQAGGLDRLISVVQASRS